MKTGVPARFTIDVEVVDRPTWPLWSLPISFWAVLIARYFTKSSAVVHIAVSPRAWQRHRREVLVAGILGGSRRVRRHIAVPGAQDSRCRAHCRSRCGRDISCGPSIDVGGSQFNRSGDDVFVTRVHPKYQSAALELDVVPMESDDQMVGHPQIALSIRESPLQSAIRPSGRSADSPDQGSRAETGFARRVHRSRLHCWHQLVGNQSRGRR